MTRPRVLSPGRHRPVGRRHPHFDWSRRFPASWRPRPAPRGPFRGPHGPELGSRRPGTGLPLRPAPRNLPAAQRREPLAPPSGCHAAGLRAPFPAGRQGPGVPGPPRPAPLSGERRPSPSARWPEAPPSRTASRSLVFLSRWLPATPGTPNSAPHAPAEDPRVTLRALT